MIKIENLKKSFITGEVSTEVLRGISLSINSGEFVAIMGPSGSGKSTLLHILGFLDRQSKGTYLFDGKAIDDYSDEEIAHVRNQKMGFIFQSFNLLARTTVFNNVMLPLVYSDIPEKKWKKITESAIEAVGLEHRMKHESSQLSGGEKQRVAIARALVNDPHVIFADEPTGNLDSKSGLIVMQIIQKLNEEQGRTVILITHETYTAEHAERIIRLHDGEIVEDVRVEERKGRDSFIK
ncbi:MAG: ABC transporter ATP-binding protein [bacterium]